MQKYESEVQDMRLILWNDRIEYRAVAHIAGNSPHVLRAQVSDLLRTGSSNTRALHRAIECQRTFSIESVSIRKPAPTIADIVLVIL